MKLGLIGLGKMGLNMAIRLLEGGHQVVAYDHHIENLETLSAHGGTRALHLKALVEALSPPRCVWLMIGAGKAVEHAVQELLPQMEKNDILVDGGNSNYHDSVRRAQSLKEKGIYFLDVGTSGGIWGRQLGYCLTIGGALDAFARAEPLFKTLAPKDGYLHVGSSGAGHFTKMVHNGIEYGLLQAYAEGFEILNAGGYDLNLARIAHVWNQGSVVRSWLLELAESAFKKNSHLEGIKDYVEDSGEGRWAVAEAIEKNIPAPVITLSLLTRLHSRQAVSFSAKFIAALRNEFGGHGVKKSETAVTPK